MAFPQIPRSVALGLLQVKSRGALRKARRIAHCLAIFAADFSPHDGPPRP
jgi:hypothetical protein